MLPAWICVALEVRRAVDWLLSIQNPDGGWGEDGTSYKLDYRGHERCAQRRLADRLGAARAHGGGRDRPPAVERGIAYLQRTQGADGTWPEEQFTGTGFPRVFYLRYHGYASLLSGVGVGAVTEA